MTQIANKTLLKVLLVPGEPFFLWNMKDESPILNVASIYSLINFDFAKWADKYSLLYKKWLDDDDDSIFDLNNEVNKSLIETIGKFNIDDSEYSLFYWYDVDRTRDKDFEWRVSPISGEPLINLGSEFHYLNRLISIGDSMVFPGKG